MASYVPQKKNDSNGCIFYVSLVSQANTVIMQVNPTLAAGDVKVAIDDAAPANLGTLPAVDADFTKRVKVTLSQAETNGDNLTIIFSDAAGDEWCDLTINIQTSAQTLDTIDTNIDTLDTVADAIKAVTDLLPNAGALSDLATILTDTNELQTDWANGGRLDLLIDTITTYVDLIDDATNGLAAIKAEVEGLAGAAMRGTNNAALEATLLTMKQKAAGTFNRETDSLEAIRDRGDVAWVGLTAIEFEED